MEDIRLDKYLWAVRVFKTRSDAADAIRTNKVTVNGSYAKPSREVKIGDVIAVRKQQVTYSYKVLDLVSSRQPAKNVPAYCLNITPQEELDKLNVRMVGQDAVEEGRVAVEREAHVTDEPRIACGKGLLIGALALVLLVVAHAREDHLHTRQPRGKAQRVARGRAGARGGEDLTRLVR